MCEGEGYQVQSRREGIATDKYVTDDGNSLNMIGRDTSWW